MIDEIIPAYLYTQYNDDKNLQALIDAYNHEAQNFYAWLRDSRLPIFQGGYNSGEQLKWIVKGIYGEDVPILKATKRAGKGPYNTVEYNILPLDAYRQLYNNDVIVVSDDLFKRVLMWNFYKGDGKQFSVSWLKRRVMRFLNGIDGADIPNDQHWPISVKFVDDVINIVIDTTGEGFSSATTMKNSSFDYAPLFKGAMEGGILNMPYYYTISVTIKE